MSAERTTRRRRRGIAYARFAVAAAGAVVILTGGSSRPAAGGVASSAPAVRVAPTGNDASCRRGPGAPACATFARAYALARGGDVVEVAGGSYPEQTILPAGDKGRAVTIRAATGASVGVAKMSILASHVHLVNIHASGVGNARGGLEVCGRECVPGLVDVVIQNFHARYAFIRSSNVTVRGGDFGGFDACQPQNPEDGFRLWGGDVSLQPSHDIVDGVTIHDITSGGDNTCQGTPHQGYHVDCMQTQGGVDIVVRNSTFYDCPTSDIQAAPWGGAVERNWLIENNSFGPTACCNSIVLTQGSPGGDCSTFVVRYNVMGQPVNDSNCGRPLQMYANIFTEYISACNDHTLEAYNVYPRGARATCPGRGNRKCDPAFVAPRATPPNYHLLARDRCARGAGDPHRFPSSDKDHVRRPQGALPDAGPYEIVVRAKPKPKKR
jgi:hypothetical protein